MIEHLDYFMNGELGNATTNDIFQDVFGRVYDILSNPHLETPDFTTLFGRTGFTRQVFVKGSIAINTKNIEATMSQHFENHIMSNKCKNNMDRLGVADVLVQLIIYRLGSYSYYLVNCTALFEPTSNDPNAEPTQLIA